MFSVLLVANEVGPSGADFWIIDTTIFEFEAEIRIDCEETSIEPPDERVSAILRKIVRSRRTGCLQGPDPSPEEGCDLDGDTPGTPVRTRHPGSNLGPF